MVITLDVMLVLAFSVVRPRVTNADAVIVLGAAVGTPALKNRTLTGYEYYRTGKTEVVVLAGGQGEYERSSEAVAMRDIVDAKVMETPSSDRAPLVLLDDTSRTTFENIRNARALIPDADSVVVISDTFHLARAVFVARRAGFSKVYWDAPAPSYYRPMELATYYVREFVGLLSYIPKFITN